MIDDLRYAIRSLRSSRGLTVVAVTIIALSIGTITPIFSIADAVWLRPLPYPDSERLVILRDQDVPIAAAGRLPMAQRNFLDWRERQQGLESIAAVRAASVMATDGTGAPTEMLVGRVTGEFFHTLRQVPALGRAIVPDDERSGGRVVVLSHGLWERRFGGDATAIGKSLVIDGAAYEIVGVAPAAFRYPAGSSRQYEAFLPYVVPPAQRAAPVRGAPFLTAIGRLRDGVGIAAAQAALDTVALDLRREHPGWEAGVVLQPYREYVAGGAVRWMRLLLWGVALVFFIMCANVANLLLARGGGRRKEVGVRAALGASRGRIARQLVVESLLLATAGTALGVLLGWWALEVYRGAIPAALPRAADIGMDWRVLAAAGAGALVTGGLFGLAPALFSTRVDLSTALKSGGTATSAVAAPRLRSALIVVEIAIALVLLAGALLFTTSFLKVSAVPLGVDYENVVVVGLNGPVFLRGPVRGPDLRARSDEFHALAARLVERARAVPGVDEAAAASGTPFSSGNVTFSFELPGRPGFAWSRDRGMVAMKMVSPNYLELLRVPLLRGRYLNERDSRGAEGAVVVSESAARMIWRDEDPLGQEIDLQQRLRVVGVVADVRMGGPEADPYPDVYVPFEQGRGTFASTLLVRTSLPPEQMLASLRSALQEVDPGQRLDEVTTLEARLERLLAQRRFNMMVIGSFGLLGVLIAGIGLYGVMAYLVAQRRHEIGVRMALGASRVRVLRLVLSRAAVLAAAGLAIGGVGSGSLRLSLERFYSSWIRSMHGCSPPPPR